MTVRGLNNFMRQFRQGAKDTMRGVRKDLPYFVEDCWSEYRKESIENGINVDSVQGFKADYSTARVPTFILAKNILNSAGATYLKFGDARSLRWYEWRLIQGLGNIRVNANYRGDFWKSFNTFARGGKVFIFYNGEMLKFEGLTQIYGEFYRVSDYVYEKKFTNRTIPLLDRLSKVYL